MDFIFKKKMNLEDGDIINIPFNAQFVTINSTGTEAMISWLEPIFK